MPKKRFEETGQTPVMAERALAILLNYSSFEQQRKAPTVRTIPEKSGVGWVFADELQTALCAQRLGKPIEHVTYEDQAFESKKMYSLIFDQTRFSLAKHIEQRMLGRNGRANNPLIYVDEKGEEHPVSAARIRQTLCTWKALYRYHYTLHRLDEFRRTSYFQSMEDVVQPAYAEFTKLLTGSRNFTPLVRLPTYGRTVESSLAGFYPELFLLCLEKPHDAEKLFREVRKEFEDQYRQLAHMKDVEDGGLQMMYLAGAVNERARQGTFFPAEFHAASGWGLGSDPMYRVGFGLPSSNHDHLNGGREEKKRSTGSRPERKKAPTRI